MLRGNFQARETGGIFSDLVSLDSQLKRAEYNRANTWFTY